MAAELMEVVAFTRPDVFDWQGGASCPYQRVVALLHNDGITRECYGERRSRNQDARIISLSQYAGQRLVSAFQKINCNQGLVNCHWYGNHMLGLAPSIFEPQVDISSLPAVNDLALGSVGLVVRTNAKGSYVPHTIGFGIGDEGLQVMSGAGEFGFALNTDVLSFYKTLNPEYYIGLRQLLPDTVVT